MDTLQLLSFSLMQQESVARLVLAISAVESLGQTIKWTTDQKLLLRELSERALRSELATPDQRQEVANAILKSAQRLSLRQGVLRLLQSLGLNDLREEWDSVYGERSNLVHGLAPQPGVRYDGLADRAVNLCGRILLKVVAVEIPGVDQNVELKYPQ
jgi:hypothetical protein